MQCSEQLIYWLKSKHQLQIQDFGSNLEWRFLVTSCQIWLFRLRSPLNWGKMLYYGFKDQIYDIFRTLNCVVQNSCCPLVSCHGYQRVGNDLPIHERIHPDAGKKRVDFGTYPSILCECWMQRMEVGYAISTEPWPLPKLSFSKIRQGKLIGLTEKTHTRDLRRIAECSRRPHQIFAKSKLQGNERSCLLLYFAGW